MPSPIEILGDATVAAIANSSTTGSGSRGLGQARVPKLYENYEALAGARVCPEPSVSCVRDPARRLVTQWQGHRLLDGALT